MVDYSKATGTAGRLIIRDSGSTVEFWISCSDPATFVGSLRWSGVVNGVAVSGTSSWSSGGGTRRIAGPWSVGTSQTVTFAIQATGTQGLGGPTSFSQVISRPLPVAPSNLTVTRVSDSQQTLTWSRNSTYTSVVVQRTTADGSSWSGWQQVGVAAGNAFTFTDKTTVPNRYYVYRVAGVAASGQSAWSPQTGVYTAPAAPTGVSAERSGDDIRVSASGTPPFAATYEIRDGETVVGTGSLPFLHVAPNPAVPHQYTVRGVVGSLAGAWSAPSNVVQLIAPPNAPTGLTPNGTVAPSDLDVPLRWVHNPVDASPQTVFELRHRLDGGAWTTVSGTTGQGADVSFDVGEVEWQVRTKGADPDWSEWSAVATFDVVDRPGVAIVQPDENWDASILVLQWTWFQAQDRPQSAWQVELLDAGVQVVEARSGSGATSAVQLNTRLTEGVWTVRARAATGDLWSLWATETFTVAFEPPGEPVLTGVWDESQGGVLLAVAGEEFGVAVLDGGVWFAEIGD